MKALRSLLVLLLLVPALAYTQNSNLEWENYAHGLSITSMTENAGSYYFGTKAGLVKMDKASHALTFYNEANSPIPSNQVETVQATTTGDIWVGTYDAGIAIIRGNDWEVMNEENSELPSSSIAAIIKDAQNRLWIGTAKGMAIIDGEAWTIEDDRQNFQWGIGAMAVDESRGDAWYTTNHTAIQFTGSSFIDHGSELQSYGIQSVTVDGNNDVWVLSSSRLSQYDGTTWTHYNYQDMPGSGVLNDIKVNMSGELVVLRDHLLLTKTATGWETEDIENNSSTYLTSLNFDKAGNLWLSDGENIYRKEANAWSATAFSTTPLSRNYIKHIALGKDGELYLTEFNGKVATFKNGKFNVIPIPSQFSSINETEMAVMPDGRLVMATEGGGLFFYDGSSWEQLNMDNSDIPTNTIWAMAVSANGDIYFGNGDIGLVKYDGNSWTTYTSANSDLPNNQIYTITAGSDGEIWIATDHPQLTKFNKDKFTNYSTSAIGGSSNVLWSLQTDPEGNVWIGSATAPLTRFDGEHFDQFPTGMTVESKFLLTLIIADNKIWAGTEGEGVFSFDMETEEYEHFDYANSPLTGNDVNDLAYDGNGTLYMATAKDLHDGVGGLTILKMGVASGIADNHKAPGSSFTIYPNPTKDLVNIRADHQLAAGAEIEVLNYLGQTVKRLKANTSAETRITVSDLQPGLYFIRLSDAGMQVVKKLLVE